MPDFVWRGLIAEYRDLLRECTEAPEEFHFACFATAVGCLVGRAAWIANPKPTYLNFYTLLVGETALARKSTAYGFAVDLLEEAGALLETSVLPMYGLASIEGLATAMGREESERPNRILCIEDEFKSLAAKAKQNSGSNIVPRLTELFNTPPKFQVNTKLNAKCIQNPFLCMLAASTQAWFEESITKSDVSGGFLNRWLLFQGASGRSIPFPKGVDTVKWEAIVESVSKKVKGAEGEFAFTEEARKVYVAFYDKVRAGTLDGVGVSEATIRIDLHAKKLALLYAILAGHKSIEREDVDSGMAVATYCAEVVKPIAEGLQRGPQAELEGRILDALRPGPLSQRDIYRKLHISAGAVRFAMKPLHEIGSVRPVSDDKWELVAM